MRVNADEQMRRNSKLQFAKNRFINRFAPFEPTDVEFTEENDESIKVSFTIGNIMTSVFTARDKLRDLYGDKGEFFYYTFYDSFTPRRFYNVIYTLEREAFEEI